MQCLAAQLSRPRQDHQWQGGEGADVDPSCVHRDGGRSKRKRAGGVGAGKTEPPYAASGPTGRKRARTAMARNPLDTIPKVCVCVCVC